MSLLWYWLCLLVGWFLALLKPQSEASISFQFYYWQGPHGVLLIRWLVMSTSQTINHSDLWDWPNCPDGILLFHWCLSSQSCKTTRFQTSGYMTIPSENFSLVGHKKDSVRKGECWFLRAVTLSFPSNKFPFLAWLPSLLSFPLHLPCRKHF